MFRSQLYLEIKKKKPALLLKPLKYLCIRLRKIVLSPQKKRIAGCFVVNGNQNPMILMTYWRFHRLRTLLQLRIQMGSWRMECLPVYILLDTIPRGLDSTITEKFALHLF